MGPVVPNDVVKCAAKKTVTLTVRANKPLCNSAQFIVRSDSAIREDTASRPFRFVQFLKLGMEPPISGGISVADRRQTGKYKNYYFS